MPAYSERLPGMVFAVTGGAGFIGSHLCTELVRRGAYVTCFDNEITGSRRNVDHLRDSATFEFVHQDVSDGIDMRRPVDVVMHLASVASPVHYSHHPVATLRSGSGGTLEALRLARRDAARFVLASTSEVYGDPEVSPQPETYWGNVNPVGPRSAYDESKRFAEAMTMGCRKEWNLATGIVRIFNTFGPRMAADDGRVVPAFVTQALTGRALTVAGSGSQTRSLCYITDTVEALIAMACHDHPGPINIGNPNELTILELAERILRSVGTELPIEFVELPEDDPRVRCPDIRLAHEVLNWAPRIQLEEGLARTVEWFRAHTIANTVATTSLP